MDIKNLITNNAILALLLEQQEIEQVKQEVGLVPGEDGYETHAGKFYTSADVITLRENADFGLGSTSFTGLVAKKYDGINDGQLVFDADGYARVGDKGSLQMIATREDAPLSNGIAFYDNNTRKFKTKAESTLSVAQSVNTNKLDNIESFRYLRNDINNPKLRVSGGLTFTLEADSDNSNESDNVSFILSQNGGGTTATLGLNSSNDLYLNHGSKQVFKYDEGEEDVIFNSTVHSSAKFNKTVLYSPENATDIMNIRRYGSDHTLLNVWSPPQTAWGGAKESTLSLVRGDGNEYFMDFYNMDYGSSDQGNNLDYGEPEMGIRLQKRGSGTYTPFYIEYGNGNEEFKAITILPNDTDTVNHTSVELNRLIANYDGNRKFETTSEGTKTIGTHTISNTSGIGEIGCKNSSWFHFETDKPAFHFNTGIHATDRFAVYGTNTYLANGMLKLNSNDWIKHTNAVNEGWEIVTDGTKDFEILRNIGIISHRDTTFKGTIGTAPFISGIGGKGTWRISQNANAEFDNLDLREGLTCNTFTNNKINISNGDLIVSDTDTIEYVEGNILYFSKEQPFRVGDILRCQGSSSPGNIKSYYITVESEGTSQSRTDDEGELMKYITFTGKTGSGTIEIGDILLRWNSSDTDRKGLLYLSSSSTYAPFYDVIYNGKTKARFGRLDGITSSTGKVLSGYGLWAQNGYFEGWLNAKEGLIANCTINSDSVSTSGWTLNSDGSGNLANGAIVWDINGKTTLGSGVTLQWEHLSAESQANLKGADGIDGTPGQDGANGYTPVKGVDYFDGVDGNDGPQGIQGPQGPKGEDGVNGTNGQDGRDGKDSPVLYFNTESITFPTLTNYAGGTKYTFTSAWAGPATIWVRARDAEGAVHCGLNSADLGIMNGPNETTLWYKFDCTLIAGSNEISIWSTTEDAGTIYELIVKAEPIKNTYIDATGLYTGTISANKINAGTLSADRIGVASIGASKIKTNELVVGDNIAMGSNATISWNNVTDTSSLTTGISNAQDAADSANSLAITLRDTQGMAYSKTITIGGDARYFYPVVIKHGNQYVQRRIVVRRGYNETAPHNNTYWNNSTTHFGALGLDIRANFGGWGGTTYGWTVDDLKQQYNTGYGGCFGGAENCMHQMGFAIFLRGGGAVYHLYSEQTVDNAQVCLSQDKIYDHSNDSYDAYAPAPKDSSSSSVRSAITALITAHRNVDGNLATTITNDTLTTTNVIATNLKIKAANIQDKLTADKIDVSTLYVGTGGIRLDNSAIISWNNISSKPSIPTVTSVTDAQNKANDAYIKAVAAQSELDDKNDAWVTTLTRNTITTSYLNAQEITSLGAVNAGSFNINNKFKVDANGYLTSTSGTIGGFTIGVNNLVGNGERDIYYTSGSGSTAGATKKVQTKIDINKNEANIRLTHSSTSGVLSGVAELGSDGILCNSAGKRCVSATTGLDYRASVVGLGFGSMSSRTYSSQEYNMMCGVFGLGSNSASSPCPTYGGYFTGGGVYASRLVVGSYTSTGSTSSGSPSTLDASKYSSFILGYSSSRRYYKLTNGVEGQIVYLFNRNDSDSAYIQTGVLADNWEYEVQGGVGLTLMYVTDTFYGGTVSDDRWVIVGRYDQNW